MSLESSKSALGYAEGVVEDLLLKIRRLRRELSEAESHLVGAREDIRRLKEQVRVEALSEPVEYVTSREVEILHMRGHTVACGEKLTPEIRAELIAAGMSSGE